MRIGQSFLLLFVLFGTFGAGAQGTAFTYQGQLQDAGQPANGSYALQFAVYSAAQAGVQQGNTLTLPAIVVSNGLFTVTLDFGTEVFSGAERWLEIAVRPTNGVSFSTLSPRQRVAAAPYAITAGAVTGPIHGAAILPATISCAQLAASCVTAQQLAPGAVAASLNASGQTQGGKSEPVVRLVAELKQQNLYADLVYLQAYGRTAQDTNNSLTLRGPRQALRGGTNYTFGLARIAANVTNNVITLPTAVSNVTLFTAMAGAYLPEIGSSGRDMLGIHSAGGWPWASHVRLYQSSGATLVAQTLGGGDQLFWTPTPTVFPFDVRPRTYALAVDGQVNSVLLAVDGWVSATGTYAHGDPTGMTDVDFGAGVSAPDYHLKGTYALQAVWNRALNTNEIKTLDAIVRRTVLPENRIVFEGDSITDYQVDGRSFWQDLFGYGSDWSLSGNPVSIATGGHSTSNITNEWPAQVLPFAPAGNIERSIVVLWVGANDVGNYPAANRSNAEILANLRTLWRQAKALGFEVCAVTLFRRTSSERATCEADVLTLNATIRADLGINYDYLVDVEAAMTAGAGESYWNNPAYFPDGVHPNTAASRAVIVEAFKLVGRTIFP